MNDKILDQIYVLGLEKFAGDEAKAKEFVEGFSKEAALWSELGTSFAGGATSALGKGIVGAGVGLGVYGLSTMMANSNQEHLRSKFSTVLAQVRAKSPLLQNAPHDKVSSYADTIFKFAPHVALDPNLLTAILNNAVHGEGIDPMTIRTLGDLEARYIDSKKGALFAPKAFSA